MEQGYFVDKNFDNQDFNRSPLPKGEYENCHFSHCQLIGVDLSEFDFTDCEFEHCDFSNAQLKKTSFKTVNFAYCKLEQV